MFKKSIVIVAIFMIMLSGCAKVEENMSIEEIYIKGLGQYLLNELNLAEYDEKIANSEMNYIPNNLDKMSESQKTNSLGLQFLYLRNDLHLERLHEEQIQILEQEAKNFDINEQEISEEAMDVIINTYSNVITPKEIKTEADKNIETVFDKKMLPDFVKMNSIVFIIGTMSEFDDEGNYVDLEHEKEKMDSLHNFAKEMEQELEGKLGEIPIRILVE